MTGPTCHKGRTPTNDPPDWPAEEDRGASSSCGPTGVSTSHARSVSRATAVVGATRPVALVPRFGAYFLTTFTTTVSVPVAPLVSVTVNVNVNEMEFFPDGTGGAVNHVAGVPELVSVTAGEPPVCVHL